MKRITLYLYFVSHVCVVLLSFVVFPSPQPSEQNFISHCCYAGWWPKKTRDAVLGYGFLCVNLPLLVQFVPGHPGKLEAKPLEDTLS